MDMAVAVIGTGNLGSRVARRLAEGGVEVVVAASDVATARAAAESIGHDVRAEEVGDAIAQADSVIFATWFGVTTELVAKYADALAGRVVIDPSNNIGPDGAGGFASLNPEGVSAGEQLASELPAGARYAKAFGSLPADQLDARATTAGETPVLFYASDDESAGAAVAELIRKSGFEPVNAGGVEASGRIEVFGDLHPFGGLDGRLVSREEALQLL
jgi:predicted dinucleotide-binding enzyme